MTSFRILDSRVSFFVHMLEINSNHRTLILISFLLAIGENPR